MFSLKQLRHSHAARNAAASLLAFVSSALCGLVSVPIAVHYLDKEQMGLWSIVFVVIGYLLWLDFGVGGATGRKIAEAMAKNDALEINRWWTLSIGVLAILGFIMLLAAGALSPFLSSLLKIPTRQTADALWLFLGTATISAIGMPFRAYPGLLLAQERFHWVPLVQSFIPWIQISVFWALLHAGCGVRAYPWAYGISQGCGWGVFAWQVHGKGFQIQIDFGGWTRSRFHELFSYSGSLALSGIIGSVVQSLPSMLLARLGGFALVPVYNLTNRGPAMMDSLCNRTTHAFYPNLQKLYVLGERGRFRNKFREVNQLAVWVSLIGAGGVLAGNRSLICWLAKADFYAGHWTNVWFATALLVVPFVNGLINLLQYSGSMGKIAIFSLLELPAGLLICWFGFRQAGLPGLACGFAILPLLVRAPYALIRGARNCGFRPWEICGNAITVLCISFAFVLIGGWWISWQSTAAIPIEIFGRMTSLPTWREVLVGSLAGLAGSVMAVRSLRAVRSS